MSASITPSPAPSTTRRPSSGQRTPQGVGPPPAGAGVTRSRSRSRAPIGTQQAWTSATGPAPYAGPSPQPYSGSINYPQTPPMSQHSPGIGGFLGAQAGVSPATGPLITRPTHSTGYSAPGNSMAPQQHHPQSNVLQAAAAGIGAQNQVGAPNGQGQVRRGGRRRLIVACDGTWASADSASNLKGEQISIPSNVVHLTRAIKNISRDGIDQIVFYQNGLGTDGTIVSRILGGAVAQGIADNVLEGYYWLCQNWLPGDEIFFIGFSRGAFTARSIAGMVDWLGLLSREGIKSVNIIFKDFENRGNPNYRSQFPDLPIRHKPSANDPAYAAQLEQAGLTRLRVSIKAIACFDTVGALGIPRVPVLERLGIQSRGLKEYTFYDTALGDRVEHAFHALALDEQRAAFTPAIWEKKPGNNTDLRQVWFPGVHTNIGGGYDDSNLSNITLAWMMAQLGHLLDMDNDYIHEQAAANEQFYRAEGFKKPRPWSLGMLYNSLTGVWILGGKKTRTPGFYTRVTPSGVVTDSLLKQTNEYIHPSARSRFVLDGKGYEDRSYYRPTGLDDYRLKLTGNEPGRGMPLAAWQSRRQGRSGPKRILNEAPLFEIERRLLSNSPNVENVVLRPEQAEAEFGDAGRPPAMDGRPSINRPPSSRPATAVGGGVDGRLKPNRRSRHASLSSPMREKFG